jgi:hypothetical protein
MDAAARHMTFLVEPDFVEAPLTQILIIHIARKTKVPSLESHAKCSNLRCVKLLWTNAGQLGSRRFAR